MIASQQFAYDLAEDEVLLRMRERQLQPGDQAQWVVDGRVEAFFKIEKGGQFIGFVFGINLDRTLGEVRRPYVQ